MIIYYEHREHMKLRPGHARAVYELLTSKFDLSFLNQGLGIGMGSGAGLGAAEQVKHLFRNRNQLQIQNQLLNTTFMTHCARTPVDSRLV